MEKPFPLKNLERLKENWIHTSIFKKKKGSLSCPNLELYLENK
jgi:hypothetical protein